MVKKLLQDSYRLIKIDELTIARHHHLHAEDDCYYLMEYRKEDGYDNQEKQLILNFKKKMSTRTTNQWRHKIEAIQILTSLFQNSVVPQVSVNTVTLVPMPPSKCKTDAEYDDRMVQLLTKSFPTNADIRELLLNNGSIRAAHDHPNARPSREEIQANMSINPQAIEGTGNSIILFDDVLTSGGHYLACKNLIKEQFPDTRVFGIFISRNIWPQPDPFEFDDFLEDDWLDI